MTTFLRPAAAARAIGVSRRTLDRWMSRGLIGHSRIDGVCFVNVADARALIAANERPRTVVPIIPPTPRPTADYAAQVAAGLAYFRTAGPPAPAARPRKNGQSL